VSARGFTLVELLLASALIAVAVLSLITMSSTAAERVKRSGQTTSAVVLTQQRLEWLRSQPWTSSVLAPGTTTEFFAGELSGYSRVTQVVDNEPREGIKQVTVRTNTPAGRNVQLVSLITE
jgi:prepilin-type N-terminal cleavage/methylation domain-containing protein